MRVLCVAAHPDDEVIGCGGTLARHAKAGDKVSVMWMTDGVSSRPSVLHDDPWKRRNEAVSACTALGFGKKLFGRKVPGGLTAGEAFSTGAGWTYSHEHETGWWAKDYPDQRLDLVALDALACGIAEAIEMVRPDVLYTHSARDLNQDHKRTAHAVLVACRAWQKPSPCKLLSFEVAESTDQEFTSTSLMFMPNYYVNITKTIDAKSAALASYKSERREPPHPRSDVMMRARAAMRGSTVGVHYAEAFTLLREVVR